MKRKALFMALSSKAGDQQLMVFDGLNMEKPKTKLIDQVLQNLSAKMKDFRMSKKKKDSLVLILPGTDKNVEQSARNLSYAKVLSAKSLNVLDILNYKYLFLLQDAVPVIKDFYKIK